MFSFFLEMCSPSLTLFCLCFILPIFASIRSLSRQRDNSVLNCVQGVSHQNKLCRISPANFHPTASASPGVLVGFLKYLFCSAVSLPLQITYNSVTFFPYSTRDLRVPDYTRDMEVVFNTFETAVNFCSSFTYFLSTF